MVKLQFKTAEKEGVLFSAFPGSYAFDDALSLEMKNGEVSERYNANIWQSLEVKARITITHC